jgi:hypothetical protein
MPETVIAKPVIIIKWEIRPHSPVARVVEDGRTSLSSIDLAKSD